MTYLIKTLSQLPLLLKGFRKEKGLTQAGMAERLGITQQSYAYFEANPATATLERLFTVLRMLDIEISLAPTSPASDVAVKPVTSVSRPRLATGETHGVYRSQPATASADQTKAAAVAGPVRITASAGKKEVW